MTTVVAAKTTAKTVTKPSVAEKIVTAAVKPSALAARASAVKAQASQQQPPAPPSVRDKAIGDQYALYCGDCCELIKGVKDNSVGFTIFSPPFSSLYAYSDDPADMGNCTGDSEFFEHFNFLIPELLRVTMPGRLCSVHSMQLPTTKQHHGEIGIRDFPGDIVKAFCGSEAADIHAAMVRIEKRIEAAYKDGDEKRAESLELAKSAIVDDLARVPPVDGLWTYHSRVVIWKDPLIAATRTKALGLAHKQICKDATRCRQGIADYLDTFLKPLGPGDKPAPVAHHGKSAGFERFIGDESQLSANEQEHLRARTSDPRTNKHSHVIWRRYASPVWMDINQTRVVGNEPGTVSYTRGREEDDEKHIAPLQLDVYERCIDLWTDENDIVFEPFGGVGSGGFVSCGMGRRYLSFELKHSYFKIAATNVKAGAKKWGDARLFA